MSEVKHVELVTETGMVYEFNMRQGSAVLKGIKKQITIVVEKEFTHNTVEDILVEINKTQNKTNEFKEIVESQNITSINIITEDKQTEYYVEWGEGDVDENSNQEAYINEQGNLVISIK